MRGKFFVGDRELWRFPWLIVRGLIFVSETLKYAPLPWLIVRSKFSSRPLHILPLAVSYLWMRKFLSARPSDFASAVTYL
jgi:hypothetical protein